MKTVIAAAGLLLGAFAAPAPATNLMGDQMKATWRLPIETSLFAFSMWPSATFTVGKGVEGAGQLSSINFMIDFRATALTFTFTTSATFSADAFNGIHFQQLGGGLFGRPRAHRASRSIASTIPDRRWR